MNEIRKQALGRGLSSLLGEAYEGENEISQLSPIEIPIENIEAGLNQPRQSFPEEELQALSVSIKDKGVMQPILVRVHPSQLGRYEIVAGERRWRAAKLANLSTIPALVRVFTDAEVLEVGLLENLQRQDLNPIDEAAGYQRLSEAFGHTQESLSRLAGKSRSHIANTVRLLTLPASAQTYLKNGQLSAGHGRAILASSHPELLTEMIVEKNLNVRQAETLAKKDLAATQDGSFLKDPDPEKEIIRQQLTDILGTPVDLVLKGVGGKIIIHFKNPNELDQVMRKLNSTEKQGGYPAGFLN